GEGRSAFPGTRGGVSSLGGHHGCPHLGRGGTAAPPSPNLRLELASTDRQPLSRPLTTERSFSKITQSVRICDPSNHPERLKGWVGRGGGARRGFRPGTVRRGAALSPPGLIRQIRNARHFLSRPSGDRNSARRGDAGAWRHRI